MQNIEYVALALKLHLLPNTIWIHTNEIFILFDFFNHEIQNQIERNRERSRDHLFRTCKVIMR